MEDLEDFNASDDEKDYGPAFCIMEGATFVQRKKDLALFGDFYMRIIGEIPDGGFLVCSFGTLVLGKQIERRIVIPASAFDSKAKFLERTRKSFGGGTFNLSEPALLERYYTFLKEEYKEENVRQYYAAECIGLQSKGKGYWCLSSEFHVHKGRVLEKEQHRYLFLDDSCKAFEVATNRRLVENQNHLRDVCNRFIRACDGFAENTVSMKLSVAFVLSRLLRINDEESWNESSIGMLHSPLGERNVGKSLTLDLLAKGQGVPTRKHPSMLAGGDQSQSGASVPVIRDTLSRTNLVVMIDDPVISANLGELIIQLQSGLTMGSRTAGVSTPGGSLLLTSNDSVTPRAEGRVLVFRYVRGSFSAEDDKRLTNGVKAIVAENIGFLLAWVITFKKNWEEKMQKYHDATRNMLQQLLPEMQPRWLKGMATVLTTYAVFHASAGVNPMSVQVMREVVAQNKSVEKENVMVRLQQSLESKLDTETKKPLGWLNPMVSVSCNGKFVPAVGISSSAMADFAQVTPKEVCQHLKQVTDSKGSIAMVFAVDESCNTVDMQKRSDKTKMAKGLKVPMMLLEPRLVEKIKDCCGIKSDHSSKSEESNSDEDQGKSTQENVDEVEQFSNELKKMDELLLNSFRALENEVLTAGEETITGTDTAPEDIFTENLTPKSKSQWDSYSPHSKNVFRKGFELAKRLPLNTSTIGETVEHAGTSPRDDTLCTPSTSSDDTAGVGPRKRLHFAEGTIGVLPKQAKRKPVAGNDNQETVPCASCGKLSPFKKRRWSGTWIECENCLKWFHLECSKLSQVPEKEDNWICSVCQELIDKK